MKGVVTWTWSMLAEGLATEVDLPGSPWTFCDGGEIDGFFGPDTHRLSTQLRPPGVETDVSCDLISGDSASAALDETSLGSVTSGSTSIAMVFDPRTVMEACFLRSGCALHLCKNYVSLPSSLPPSAPPNQNWYALDELTDLPNKRTLHIHQFLSGRQSWA